MQVRNSFGFLLSLLPKLYVCYSKGVTSIIFVYIYIYIYGLYFRWFVPDKSYIVTYGIHALWSTISSIGLCILMKASSIRSMKSSLSSTFEVNCLQLFISTNFLAANKTSSKTRTKVTPYICTSWNVLYFEPGCLIDVLCLEIAL